jgi:hypothetical protein
MLETALLETALEETALEETVQLEILHLIPVQDGLVMHLLVQDLLEETAKLGVDGVLVVLQEIDSVELEIPVLHLIKLVTVKLGMLVVHGMLETATTSQMYVTQTMQLLVQMETVIQELVIQETSQAILVKLGVVHHLVVLPLAALHLAVQRLLVHHLLVHLLQTVIAKHVSQHI